MTDVSTIDTWIVGGGTAGHVLPGVAIGTALVEAGHAAESIHFIGSERGVERTLVPAAGFEQTLLPGRGIQRRPTTDNIGAILGLIRAFVIAFGSLRDHRPDVVVALGGYASVPAGVAAILTRTPIVVAEQNAVPGLANRLIGRFAKACAVSFEGTALPRAEWTGNPVRDEILAVAEERFARRAAARDALGIDDDTRLVVVFGGSLGARRINDAVVDALPELKSRPRLHVRHIVGRRDHADVMARVSDDIDPNAYSAVDYENDMASMYAAADLVVCRAGATSCAELAATGTPSVLVPLPGAPGDHQTANARALESIGGAELVADHLFDAEMLMSVLDRLLGDDAVLAAMATAAQSAARTDAADAVAALVDAHRSRR